MSDIQTRIKHAVFRLARRFAFVQRQIAEARDNTLKSVYADMAKSIEGHHFARALPEQGLSKVMIIDHFFDAMKQNSNLIFFFRKN